MSDSSKVLPLVVLAIVILLVSFAFGFTYGRKDAADVNRYKAQSLENRGSEEIDKKVKCKCQI